MKKGRAKSELPLRTAWETDKQLIYSCMFLNTLLFKGVCFMANAKIEFAIGGISFSSEGEETWVAAQLDKIITQAPTLGEAQDNSDSELKKPMASDPVIATKTLPAFLAEKNAHSNQVKKYLATAVWLESKGNKRLSSKDVSNALKESKQNKLTNAAECLAKNIKKGFCEKDGSQFFVTEVGKGSL
jgi:hypothetical protein